MRRRAALAGALLLAAACRGTLSPLSNKIKVGEEAYVVFSAPGEDGLGDLFASPAEGGTVHQVTFSRVDERLPALAPDGAMLAFTRSRRPGDTTGVHVAVMNLLNGKERRIAGELGGTPTALAWSPDGATLYARTPAGIRSVAAPPATGSWQEAPAGDSVFAVRVGDPVFGVVTTCPASGAVPSPRAAEPPSRRAVEPPSPRAAEPPSRRAVEPPSNALCIRLPSDSLVPLAATGKAPARWAGDSVAYRDGADWVVRPLAGGKVRVIHWTRPVTPEALTVFPGPQ